MGDGDVPTAARLHFELEVQPEAPGCTWHASLLDSATGERREFDSPLALLRHLVTRSVPPPQGGLR